MCSKEVAGFQAYKSLSGCQRKTLGSINSPVVRAENLRFKEEGVRDVLKDVLLPWYNAYRFFIQNILRLQKVWAAVLCGVGWGGEMDKQALWVGVQSPCGGYR